MIAQPKYVHTEEIHVARCCSMCKHYDSDMPGEYSGHCRERVYPYPIDVGATMDMHIEVRHYNTCSLWSKR